MTFRVQPAVRQSEVLGRIAKYLAERARIIDQYGWNGDGAVWLLMPHCPPEPAGKIGEDICQRFSCTEAKVGHELYHYVGENRRPGDDRGAPCGLDEVAVVHADANGKDISHHRDSLDQSVQALSPVVSRAMPRSKRAFDIGLAAAGLLAALPVFAVVGALIKLTSRGPVFFGQLRCGRGGKPFRIYKFRTMIVDAERLKPALRAQNEQDGPAFKIRNDPRITKIGRLLRATGIDELPQLWNVLRGDMSIVGPRPLPVDETANCAPWQQERLDITPGLTCWWQVSDRWANIAFADWMRMDIRYARQRSLMTDLKLIIRTIGFMIRRKGT